VVPLVIEPLPAGAKAGLVVDPSSSIPSSAQGGFPTSPPRAAPPPTATTRGAPPPPARATSQAERLFMEGREASARGDLATARTKLQQSHALEPATGTLLNLGDVESRMGDTANARLHFKEAYHRATAAGQVDRAAFAKTRLDALPP